MKGILCLVLLCVSFASPDDSCPVGSGPGCGTFLPNISAWRDNPNAIFLYEDPPIVMFENFLTDAEMEHIIKTGRARLEPSTTGMGYQGNDVRTSHSGWLNAREDADDEVLRGIDKRIELLSGFPAANMEPYQLLRYRKTQKYGLHHDWLDEQRWQPCGGRVATFFMYLSSVAKGGETRFHRLGNVSVQPKKGSAVLWWNINLKQLFDGASPEKVDVEPLMEHESVPVRKGVKLAVNRWIHFYEHMDNYFAGRLITDEQKRLAAEREAQR